MAVIMLPDQPLDWLARGLQRERRTVMPAMDPMDVSPIDLIRPAEPQARPRDRSGEGERFADLLQARVDAARRPAPAEETTAASADPDADENAAAEETSGTPQINILMMPLVVAAASLPPGQPSPAADGASALAAGPAEMQAAAADPAAPVPIVDAVAPTAGIVPADQAAIQGAATPAAEGEAAAASAGKTVIEATTAVSTAKAAPVGKAPADAGIPQAPAETAMADPALQMPAEQPVDDRPAATTESTEIVEVARPERATHTPAPKQAAAPDQPQVPQPVVGTPAAPTDPAAGVRALAAGIEAAPPAPADQVVVRLQKAASEGIDRLSFQLKPAHLGRVDIRMELGHDGRIQAVIAADRPDTLQLLQRDARVLQQALQDAGFRPDGGSLSFDLSGRGQDPRAFANEVAPRPDPSTPASATPAAPVAEVIVPGWRAGQGGVDLRV
jgi:flagellar hook-length control protein FliK